jgi:prevent-host-death family protein
MEVNVHHAKTHLSKLIAAVESGEEVIIARNGKPAVKLVIATPAAHKSRKHMLSSAKGMLGNMDAAFSPETGAEIEAMFYADNPNDELA